jgi:hypothetical protein
MPRYDILVVEDHEIPAGKDWLMIEHRDGLLCVLRRTATGNPQVLADTWAAARRPPSPLQATG